MEYTSTITGKSLTSVFYSKFVDYIDDRSMKEIIRDFFIANVVAYAVGMFTSPSLVISLLKWHDGVIPTLLLISLVIVHAKWLTLSLVDLGSSLIPDAPIGDAIEGIPTTEVLDHLFLARSMKVKEVTAKFKVPQYRVEELVKHLKRVSVLVPGENNASVLNAEFSRQDVASILKGATNARDLRPLFRRDGNRLTSEPSAQQIESRVSDALTPPLPAHNFVSRTLATAC